MIIQQCDICKRKVPILEKAKKEYEKEIEYEYCILDSRLKSKERNLIKNLKQENNKGIVVKEVH